MGLFDGFSDSRFSSDNPYLNQNIYQIIGNKLSSNNSSSGSGFSGLDSLHRLSYKINYPSMTDAEVAQAWEAEQSGNDSLLQSIKDAAQQRYNDSIAASKAENQKQSFSDYISNYQNAGASSASSLPDGSDLYTGKSSFSVEPTDASDADKNPEINVQDSSAGSGLNNPVLGNGSNGISSNVSNHFPVFGSAAGDYYKSLMNVKSDTENPWNENTKGVLSDILSYSPKTSGDYAEEAYSKIVKNLIGTGWAPKADQMIRDNVLNAYKLDVAANKEQVANENDSAVRSLIGRGLEQLQNVKNPEEASALASALSNIGAKGFASGMYNDYFINPREAATLRGQGATGLMNYDSHRYSSDVNGYRIANSGTGLDGNFNKMIQAGSNLGSNGCGYGVQGLLFGNPYSALISPDCDVTYQNALSKGVLDRSGQHGYGDAILLQKQGGDGTYASHIVVSDGQGGYYGNSSSLADSAAEGQSSMVHRTNLAADFPNYWIAGVIHSGQGFAQPTASNQKQNKADEKARGAFESAITAAYFGSSSDAEKNFAKAMSLARTDSDRAKLAQAADQYGQKYKLPDLSEKYAGFRGQNPVG